MKPIVRGDRNQCAGCKALFNSTAAFDKHRTGNFGTPDSTSANRSCLSADEMAAKGMAVNAAGYWVTSLNPNFAQPCEVPA